MARLQSIELISRGLLRKRPFFCVVSVLNTAYMESSSFLSGRILPYLKKRHISAAFHIVHNDHVSSSARRSSGTSYTFRRLLSEAAGL